MTDRYLQIDAGRVVFDISRLREAFPEIEEDDELLADCLVGETDIDGVMTRLFTAMTLDKGMAGAAKAAKDDLAARQKRFEARADQKKALMLAIMEAASLQKLALPVATFSVSDGRAGAVVENADELPQGFVEVVRKPKIAEITKSFLAGEPVPGASLQFGDPFLTIRSK